MDSQFVLLLWLGLVCLLRNVQPYQRIDYCSATYCKSDNLACNNNGSFNQLCLPTTRSVSITMYRKLITEIFNSYRELIARGTERLHPAARMAKMSWSTELEYLASLRLKTCDYDADYCLSSPRFYYVGSNMGVAHYTGESLSKTNDELISLIIKTWFSGELGLSKAYTIYLPEQLLSGATANAALLLRDNNNQFGCAAIRRNKDMFQTFVFSCAFATDLFVARPIYKWSARAGSGCTKLDNNSKTLCAVDEPYENHKKIPNVKIFKRIQY